LAGGGVSAPVVLEGFAGEAHCHVITGPATREIADPRPCFPR